MIEVNTPLDWCLICKVNVAKFLEGRMKKGLNISSNTLITKEYFMDIAGIEKPVRHLPWKWCQMKQITILDPDGWREDKKSLNIPLTEDEFMARMARSTCTKFENSAKKEPETTLKVRPANYGSWEWRLKETDRIRHLNEVKFSSVLHTIVDNQLAIMNVLKYLDLKGQI